MVKRTLLLGLVSGLLAGIAALVYQKVYTSSLGADFSKIVKPAGIILTSVIGTLIASIGYWLLHKALKGKTDVVFNLLFAILTFASIIPAFGMKLPLDMETPELFPGLVIPMHFFPILAWMTLRPMFLRDAREYVIVKKD